MIEKTFKIRVVSLTGARDEMNWAAYVDDLPGLGATSRARAIQAIKLKTFQLLAWWKPGDLGLERLPDQISFEVEDGPPMTLSVEGSEKP